MMGQAGQRILIVDDDRDTCTNFSDILQELGFNTDVAHDGPSALRLVRANYYDIALLDFMMPEMDGATLFREIKKIRPETNAVMITAYAGKDGAQAARDAGAMRILSKPVEMQELINLVSEA